MSVYDVADLVAKLPEHQQQLLQVQLLLASDPSNAELLSIRDSLLQVVNLTLELTGAAVAPAEVAGGPQIAPIAEAEQAEEPPAEEDEKRNEQPKPEYKAGDKCLAVWPEDGNLYPARIDSISRPHTATERGAGEHEEDEDEDEEKAKREERDDDAKQAQQQHEEPMCMVTYLEYGNRSKVPLSCLRPWDTPAPEDLTKGARVLALNPLDGMIHAAVVEAGPLEPIGYYRVRFPRLKSQIEVSRHDMLPRKAFWTVEELSGEPDASAPLSAEAASAAAAAGHDGAGVESSIMAPPPELVIPESLKPVITDTEKQKEIKKKKVKRLKSIHRQKVKEVESLKRKHNWQDFISGVKKGKTKQSIFASPDTVEGKVGVVGSGRGVTEFKQRDKHRFTADGDVIEGEGGGGEEE